MRLNLSISKAVRKIEEHRCEQKAAGNAEGLPTLHLVLHAQTHAYAAS